MNKPTTTKILFSCCVALATNTTFANDTITPPHPGAVPAYIDGQIYYPEIKLNPRRNDQWNALAFPADATLKLHSRPGAKQTFFLDVDGHIETIGGQLAAIWNRQKDVKGPVISGPIDLDGNPDSFNTRELIAIQKLWLSIAGSYAAYDINVTTEDPGVDAIGRFSISDDTYGTRIVFGSIPSYAAATGGPDYENVLTRRFNDEVAVPSPTYAGQITFGMGNKGLPLHESGHTIAMYHPPRTNDVIDGQTISIGNTGLDSEVSWRSIMGGGVVTNLNHHLLPDLAGLYFRTVKQRPDDHGNTLETASDLMSYSSGKKLGNYGVIESNVDLDIFSFTLSQQQALNIHTQPAEWGHSLDALSMLFDSNGKELARSNPENHLDNWLNLTLDAGTYYLGVRGTGRAPTAGYHTGYLDFGSTGAYTVFIDFLNNEPDAPRANDDAFLVKKATSFGNNGLYTLDVLANDQTSNGPLKIVSFTRPSADIATNPGHTNSEYFALKNNKFQYKLRYSKFVGTDQFTYTVEDSKGYQQTADVTIHVQRQDQIFANADRMQTQINQAVSINALENDVVTTGSATISSVTQPTEGQVAFTAAGQLTYTPNDNFSGSDSFSYTASANGETSSAKVSVKIFPASGLLLTNDQRTTSEDIAVPVHVLKNDSTLTGELQLVSVGVPSKGTATIAQDQSIEYTPNLNVSGQDEFTYQVSNGTDTESGNVKIIIRSFNDNPVGVDDLVSTPVNTAVTFKVLDNDTDVDSRGLSFRTFSLPKFGALTADRNRRQFTYTPNEGVCGSDKFIYNITDNNLGRGAAEVTINITGNEQECTSIIPAEEAPVEDTPTEETPTEETPTEETPTEETPTEETPTEETPTEETPTEETPTEEAPTEETPTEEAPTEETPTEEAPTEEAPTEEAPTEEAPTEEAPTEEAPTEEAPTEEAPTEESPNEASAESGSGGGGSGWLLTLLLLPLLRIIKKKR